jgi:hypothetical protein
MPAFILLKDRLFVSTALVGVLFGYARNAYAACVNNGGTTYLCSGANAAQGIYANEASVSTAVGFSVSTANGSAIIISGDGALSFTDTHASAITSTAAVPYGLLINAAADDGGTPGSITVNSNSNITGSNLGGIGAFNYGTGALSITANGDVTGTTYSGIIAENSAAGTSLTITTGVGSHVTGNHYGMYVNNHGGALSITANGDVTGTTKYGIFAKNYGTNLTITTGAGSHITGGNKGIAAYNHGTGALSITANGDVTTTGGNTIGIYAGNYGTDLTVTTGSSSHVTGTLIGISTENYGTGALSVIANGVVTGTTQDGIYAGNHATGTNLSVTTGASSHVTGVTGIAAYNHGTGALSITADGDVTGTTKYGIFAKNYGTNLTITAGAGSHVTGSNTGIGAYNHGTGALSVTTNGDVTGTSDYGISAFNFAGTSLTITTGTGTTVSGITYGIEAYNKGTGALSITVNGDVISTTGNGIYAMSNHATNSITLQDGSIVSGATGIFGKANTQLNVTLDGTASPVTVTGTGGTAIQLGNQGDTLTMQGAVTIHGDVTDGSGANTLNLGAGTINLPDAGHKTISGFETINVTGASVVNGDIDASGNDLSFSGAGHSLELNGLLTATSLTIGSGATFGGSNTFTGNLIVASGGTLSPGDPVTMHVTGNLTFNTGATFEVQVDGASSDLVTATGNITIQPGVTLDIVPLGSFSGSSLAFLSAGGTLSGTFSTVDLNGVATTIVYTANGAEFGATLLAASPNSLNAETLSMQQDSLLFSDTVLDASALSMVDKEKHLWFKGIVENDQHGTNGNYAGFNNDIAGIAMGGEQALSEHWKIGAALAQLEGTADVQSSPDSARSSGTFAAIYGTYMHPIEGMNLFATSGVTGGYFANDARRPVSNSGVESIAKSNSDAMAAGIFAQLGAELPVRNGWSLMPKLSAAYTHIEAGGFDEYGGGLAGISMDGYATGVWKLSEGVMLSHADGINIAGLNLKPHLTVGLSQERDTGGNNVHGAFSNATPLVLAFDRSGSHFLNTGFGLDYTLSDGITGFIAYQNAYSHSESQNAAKAGVTIAF